MLIYLFILLALPAYPVPFERGGRYGFKDARTGKVVLPARYATVEPFTPGGIAAVGDDDGFAWIDRAGKVKARAFNFDNGADPFREERARFIEAGKVGFIGPAGEVAIPATLDFARPFSEGRAAFCVGCKAVRVDDHTLMEGGRWGFIDRQGKPVIEPTWDAVGDFEAGLATARGPAFDGHIDLGGAMVTRPATAPASVAPPR